MVNMLSESGFCHNDLHVENIIINSDYLHVIDFGKAYIPPISWPDIDVTKLKIKTTSPQELITEIIKNKDVHALDYDSEFNKLCHTMPEMKNNVWADIAGLSMYLVSRLSDVKYLSNIITVGLERHFCLSRREQSI